MKSDPQGDHREPSEAPVEPPRSGLAELRSVGSGGQVRLSFVHTAPGLAETLDERVLDARIAAAGFDDPRAEDRVLAMTDASGATWVIGMVGAPRPASLIEETLARSAPPPGPQVVRDRHGRLLFEYDPESDRSVLHAPSGDLEISAPQGTLRMSARDLVIDGDRRVEITAARGEASSRLSMEQGELTLVGAVVTAAAERAELIAHRVGVKAHALESHVDRVRHVAKVIDVRAGRIVERAKDVYREASGLSQTRAGRLRLIAKKTAQLVGENTLLKARDRMKVKGERIHLA